MQTTTMVMRFILIEYGRRVKLCFSVCEIMLRSGLINGEMDAL
jgi:hypothetical protein